MPNGIFRDTLSEPVTLLCHECGYGVTTNEARGCDLCGAVLCQECARQDAHTAKLDPDLDDFGFEVEDGDGVCMTIRVGPQSTEQPQP